MSVLTLNFTRYDGEEREIESIELCGAVIEADGYEQSSWRSIASFGTDHETYIDLVERQANRAFKLVNETLDRERELMREAGEDSRSVILLQANGNFDRVLKSQGVISKTFELIQADGRDNIEVFLKEGLVSSGYRVRLEATITNAPDEPMEEKIHRQVTQLLSSIWDALAAAERVDLSHRHREKVNYYRRGTELTPLDTTEVDQALKAYQERKEKVAKLRCDLAKTLGAEVDTHSIHERLPVHRDQFMGVSERLRVRDADLMKNIKKYLSERLESN